MPAKAATQLNLLQNCNIYIIHNINTPHYSWEIQGMSALVLYSMSISQTPAFQSPGEGTAPSRMTQSSEGPLK